MSSIEATVSLSELKPWNQKWTVEVKVLHAWKQYTPKTGETLEMVLSDEEGVKIQATCKKTYFALLERHCRVGTWVFITNFSLGEPFSGSRMTRHVYKMSFMATTKIRPSPIQNDDIYLDLVDFDTILSGTHDDDILMDVIGEVLDLGAVRTLVCQGKEKKRVEFTLRDINDQRLKCCLWGKFAEMFDSENIQSSTGVVCLIRFAKLGKYRGELQVSNVYDASLVFINPNIEEANALKQMFHVEGNAIVVSDPDTVKSVVKYKEVTWSEFPFLTIEEIKSIQVTENFRLVATVYAIDTDWAWYYFACVPCNKKVFKMTNGKVPTWWCEGCSRAITRVAPKFNLRLKVKDQTGESKLLLLDTVAQKMLKVEANKILQGSLDEIEDPEDLPDDIRNLIGKSYGFGISVEDSNVTYKVNVFKTLKVWSLEEAGNTDSIVDSLNLSDKKSTLMSGGEVSLPLTDTSGSSETLSTPSSKRAMDENKLAEDGSSTTKKLCTKAIKLEKITQEEAKTTKEEAKANNSG